MAKQKLEGVERPISIEKMNKLLIEAFDDRPIVSAETKSKAVYDFEKSWNEEVQKFTKLPDIDLEELEDMIS